VLQLIEKSIVLRVQPGSGKQFVVWSSKFGVGAEVRRTCTLNGVSTVEQCFNCWRFDSRNRVWFVNGKRECCNRRPMKTNGAKDSCAVL
jgi:hypothetical protein